VEEHCFGCALALCECADEYNSSQSIMFYSEPRELNIVWQLT